ncbi:unnamed protein product [Prorocentrum cordatum]|uniref:Palmitoyltransferase n=1 Tax=Prorocentrum cordatum TaxID=2364126 RepID=A0ABN9XW43_9DINO|nr:unnamed protein product [Polarella glacialis]
MRSLEASGEADIDRLCTTTWVLKGPRTKFCVRTNACVREFDHFCGWLNVAIGRGNHRPFIFLSCLEPAVQFCHLYLCWIAAGALVEASTDGSSTWALSVATGYPLLVLISCLHVMTAPMVTLLALNQLKLIWVNLTTNEMLNSYRYGHFWEEVERDGAKKKVFKNPFHKGNAVRNCLDFWWTRSRDRGPTPVSLAELSVRDKLRSQPASWQGQSWGKGSTPNHLESLRTTRRIRLTVSPTACASFAAPCDKAWAFEAVTNVAIFNMSCVTPVYHELAKARLLEKPRIHSSVAPAAGAVAAGDSMSNVANLLFWAGAARTAHQPGRLSVQRGAATLPVDLRNYKMRCRQAKQLWLRQLRYQAFACSIVAFNFDIFLSADSAATFDCMGYPTTRVCDRRTRVPLPGGIALLSVCCESRAGANGDAGLLGFLAQLVLSLGVMWVIRAGWDTTPDELGGSASCAWCEGRRRHLRARRAGAAVLRLDVVRRLCIRAPISMQPAGLRSQRAMQMPVRFKALDVHPLVGPEIEAWTPSAATYENARLNRLIGAAKEHRSPCKMARGQANQGEGRIFSSFAARAAAVAGCSGATSLARLLLPCPLKGASAAGPCVSLRNVVDDVLVDATGTRGLAVGQATACVAGLLSDFAEIDPPLARGENRCLAPDAAQLAELPMRGSSGKLNADILQIRMLPMAVFIDGSDARQQLPFHSRAKPMNGPLSKAGFDEAVKSSKGCSELDGWSSKEIRLLAKVLPQTVQELSDFGWMLRHFVFDIAHVRLLKYFDACSLGRLSASPKGENLPCLFRSAVF